MAHTRQNAAFMGDQPAPPDLMKPSSRKERQPALKAGHRTIVIDGQKLDLGGQAIHLVKRGGIDTNESKPHLRCRQHCRQSALRAMAS